MKQIRRDGFIPAVLYGSDHENTTLAVAERELARLFKEHGYSTLVSLGGAGSEGDEKLAIIKDVQYHPVSGRVIHLDFYGIRIGVPIDVEVPLVFEGKAIGISKGGVLQPARRTLVIKCLPREIPEHITIDVANLDVGDAIHVHDLDIEGIEFVAPVNFTIVTVQGTKAEETEAAEEEIEAEVEESQAVEE
ncbi:MAG: 50S ribosomal protein L25 [Deltaproteobacteria bacterium]|nr:50S ribosomal protein L25 [Candidatus Anaeroferrophillus wilburensis]MBN2888738.1 50S ribosomal protein L25 [Deltaproteobacteria bacterium]